MQFHFAAKSELNTCAGMNGQIPWTAIRDYGLTYGLTVEEIDDFTRMIRALEEGMREGQEDLDSEKPKEQVNED